MGESDRLRRLACILRHAEAVLGSRDKALAFLRQPHAALGPKKPLALLDTEDGMQQVEAFLTDIECTLRMRHPVSI